VKNKNSNRRPPDRDEHNDYEPGEPEQVGAAHIISPMMENLFQFCGVCAVVLGLIGTVLSLIHTHRDASIWTFCAAAVIAVFGVFCWLQDKAWKADASDLLKSAPTVTSISSSHSSTPPPSPITATGPIAATQTASPVPLGNFSENQGAISPGEEKTPDLPDTIPQQVVASSGFIFIGKMIVWSPFFPFSAIRQQGEDMISLSLQGQDILVSAMFFDVDGKIVCQIINNKFYLNPNNYFRSERTAHSLRVFDNEARETLFVNYLNPRAIQIFGDFYLRNKTHVILRKDYTSIGNIQMSPVLGRCAVGLNIQ
jgi:hypothetical protein